MREKIEDIDQRFIRDHTPEEHGAFYERLPYDRLSNYFHDHVAPGTTGTTTRSMSPRGKLTRDETSTRRIVLLSTGGGVTPMISLPERLSRSDVGCGCERKVWFIHGARNARLATSELVEGDVECICDPMIA